MITGVAQRCPERLRELVYLDAFVPGPGQSVLDLLAPARREHFLQLVDGAGRIVLDRDVAMDGWAVTDPGSPRPPESTRPGGSTSSPPGTTR